MKPWGKSNRPNLTMGSHDRHSAKFGAIKFAKFQNLYDNNYINKGAVPQGSETENDTYAIRASASNAVSSLPHS